MNLVRLSNPRHPIPPARHGVVNDDQANGGLDFDVDSWMAMLEEQRQRIAAVAGVCPSKVTIQIGH